MLAAQHPRQYLRHIIWQRTRQRILETLAAGWRDVVGAAPFVHLLLTPFLARVVFVEADQLAVIALVERLVLEHRDLGLPQLFQHQIERALRADERGGEGDVELDALAFKLAAGLARLGDALVGQVDIAPAGEKVLQVPVALAVPHEHEKTISHFTALSHLRNLSVPAHPSSNRARAFACAPIMPVSYTHLRAHETVLE